DFLWAGRARGRRRQRFADVLRLLAILARLGARAHTGAEVDPELHDVRRKIAQGLGEAQRLLEESKFEAEAGELEDFQRGLGDAQIIFLMLLSLAYQRRASGSPLRDLPEAARDLEDAVARTLESLADEIDVGKARPPADLAP